jgi:phosphatidylinositol dimannoside acyltransferase
MSVPLREGLVDAGFGAGWRLVRALPAPVAAGAFAAGADLATWRRGSGVRQLRRNLGRVVPAASEHELDALVRAGMRSYARYWCETFRLPAMDTVALRERLGPLIAGKEHLEAGLDAGRGVIIALPHSGNWDVAGVWLAGRCNGFTAVVERLRPESLYRRFVAFRGGLGFEIVPTTGGPEPVADVLARRLREGGAVCLVADRALSGGGVRVSFFGEPARMPSGPAKLAQLTGAALLPAGLWFTPGGWGFRVHPRVDVSDVRAATQAVADVFAAEIAEHPQDWHMLQPLWTADRPIRLTEMREPVR